VTPARAADRDKLHIPAVRDAGAKLGPKLVIAGDAATSGFTLAAASLAGIVTSARDERDRLRARAQPGSEWSPHIRYGNGNRAELSGVGGRRLDLRAVPVTVLGQRLVLSHFTASRRGARIMLSTRF
jgi:hypothetical protein